MTQVHCSCFGFGDASGQCAILCCVQRSEDRSSGVAVEGLAIDKGAFHVHGDDLTAAEDVSPSIASEEHDAQGSADDLDRLTKVRLA